MCVLLLSLSLCVSVKWTQFVFICSGMRSICNANTAGRAFRTRVRVMPIEFGKLNWPDRLDNRVLNQHTDTLTHTQTHTRAIRRQARKGQLGQKNDRDRRRPP